MAHFFTMNRFFKLAVSVCVAVLMLLAGSGCQKEEPSIKTLAFITDGSSDFWDRARRGVDAADEQLENYTVEFRIPGGGSPMEQRRIFEDLIARGVAGIAICPMDPDNATKWLNQGASKTFLMTVGSDAPDSARQVYVGTDNEKAGIMAGGVIRDELLPTGGKIVLFAGSKDNANIKERVLGLQVAFSNASQQIEIVDFLTDGYDRLRAIANVEDALVKHRDVKVLVGLSSYNGPAIYNAVRAARKAGKVRVVCFDSEAGTIEGIKRGIIYAAIVQRPWKFGNEAVTMMAAYLDGDTKAVPATKKKLHQTEVIKKAEVWDYETFYR